jgi:L-amino acid N-acyltransferase YncA
MTTFTLADGRRMLIRPIRPDDAAELQRALKRLSVESVHRRFHAAKPRLTATELRYLTEIDGRNHIALVAVEVTSPHRIMAVARAVRLADEPNTAEWAIVVGDPVQHNGLGLHMIDRLAQEASAAGIRRLKAIMQDDNDAVHRLLARLDGTRVLDEHAGGLHEVVIALAA